MMYVSVESSRNTEQWETHLNACKDTWKTTLIPGDELYFIFGDPNKDSMFDDNFFSITGLKPKEDEIFYPVVDHYHKTVFKTLLNMRDFLDTDHNFYVRTHTGSYLNLKLMNDLCKKLPTINLYAGQILYYPCPEDPQISYATGSCFILSRDVVKRIIDVVLSQKHAIFKAPDDVFFGYFINKVLNIPIINLTKIDVRESLDFFDPDAAHYYFTEFSNKHKKTHNYRVDLYHEVHQKFLEQYN